MAKVLDLDEARRLLADSHRQITSAPKGRDYGPRHVQDVMNKTESRYANLLYARKLAREIIDYRFESVKLRLAEEKCWLTLDFAVWFPDGTVELIDVKGGPTQDKTIIKLKVAADRYRGLYRIVLERYEKAGWDRREF